MSSVLALLLCAAGGTVYEATLGETGEKTAEITTAEMRQILEKKSAVVFDSRPAREFAVGHIPGALNVSAKPGVPISVYVSDVKEIERAVKGDKSTPVVLNTRILVVGADAAQARSLADAVAREAFNNVAFFSDDPAQIRAEK